MPGAAPSFDHRIGRLLRAHGLSGELVLQLFRTRRVDARRQRWLAAEPPQPIELELFDTSTEIHGVTAAKVVDGATVLIRLVDVEDRTGAERLVGAFVDVDPRRPPELITDDVDRLYGARVFIDDDAEALGTVDDIRDNGAQPILLVGEDAVMIPAIPPFIETVESSDDGTIVRVRSIPGLVEANRT